MKIDLFIPPAVDDVAWAAGYVVRCKPENDCASLFGPDTMPMTYSNLTLAFKDAQQHAKTCPHEHAVVVIARGPASVGSDVKDSTRETVRGPDATGYSPTEDPERHARVALAGAPSWERDALDAISPGGFRHPWVRGCAERGCVRFEVLP